MPTWENARLSVLKKTRSPATVRIAQRLCGFADCPAIARQHHACNLPEHMADEAAAVEPGLGRHAAQTIRTADQTDGIEGNIFGGRAGMGGREQQGSQKGSSAISFMD